MMRTCLCVFFIFILSHIGVSQDTCTSYQFRKVYTATAACEIYDIIEAADQGIVGVGRINTNSYDALIIKMDKKGNNLWAKSIGGPGEDFFKKVKQTSDGGYVTIGQSNSYNGGSIFMVKLDQSGNVQFARILDGSSVLIDKAFDIIQTSDGGYAITAEDGPLFNALVVIRIDLNGALIWEKNYNTAFSATNTPGGIAEENDSLVVTGNAQDVTFGFSEFGMIMKVNKQNGNVYWAKRWPSTTQPTFSGFAKAVDGYYVTNYLNGKQSVCRLDVNGNVLQVFYLVESPSPFISLTPTHDGGVVISRRTSPANIVKYDGMPALQWARKFTFPLATSYFQQVRETGTNQIIGAGFFIQPGMPTSILLVKHNGNGVSTSCPDSTFSSSVSLVPVTSQLFTWSAIRSDPSFIDMLVTPTSTDIVLTLNNVCSTMTGATCDSVKLHGRDTACIIHDIVTYTATRNLACHTPVQFSVDPSRATIISSTDSSAKIIFVQTGVVKVFISLNNSCRILKDSITVHAYNSPDSIQLGPDVQLCPNRHDTLHAGPGFKTYKWQDGSTDSLLVVNLPGQYFVRATNYCGGIFYDTINITTAPAPFLNIGNDTLKCNGDTLTLTATPGFNSYTWSPNYRINSLSGQIVKVFPDVDTIYSLIAVQNSGCMALDSIKISVYHSAVIHLGADTSLCNGQSLSLNAGSGFARYLWNTGATTQQINVTGIGQYSVIGTDAHQCISRDTLNIISVFPNPIVSLQKDTAFCQGSNFLLAPGAGYTKYLWQDSSVNSTYSVRAIGKYWVTVSDIYGCKGSDTTEIKNIFHIPSNFIVHDTAVCEQQKIILQPFSTFPGYLWSDGSVGKALVISVPGNYWLTVTDSNGCASRENINVAPKNCVKAVYFPNAFSPNGDGRNDVFKPTVYSTLLNFHLMVYNRYGQKVFESFNADTGWDGRFNGFQLDTNAFTWYAEYQFPNEPAKSQKGSVVVIR